MELDPKDLEELGIAPSEYVSDDVPTRRVWFVLAGCAVFLAVIFS